MEVRKNILKGTPALQPFPVLSKDDMTDELDLHGAAGSVSHKSTLHTLPLVHVAGARRVSLLRQ